MWGGVLRGVGGGGGGRVGSIRTVAGNRESLWHVPRTIRGAL